MSGRLFHRMGVIPLSAGFAVAWSRFQILGICSLPACDLGKVLASPGSVSSSARWGEAGIGAEAVEVKGLGERGALDHRQAGGDQGACGGRWSQHKLGCRKFKGSGDKFQRQSRRPSVLHFVCV